MQRLQAVVVRDTLTRQDLNQFIGIIVDLSDPINVYLSISDLTEERRFVYFFAYSIGKKKVAAWGIYDTANDDISFDGACQYAVSELYRLTKLRKQQGFEYVGNAIEDRAYKRIQFYLDREVIPREDYERNKYILAYFDGIISKEQANSVLGPGYIDNYLDDFSFKSQLNPEDPEYHDYLSMTLLDLRKKIFEFEKHANRLDLANGIPPYLIQRIEEITKRIYDKISHGEISSDQFYSMLSRCPGYETCNQGFREGCEVYFYGSSEELDERYFHEEDPRFFM